MRFTNTNEFLHEETRKILRDVKKVKGEVLVIKDLIRPSYYKKKFLEENVDELKKDNHKRKNSKSTHPERLIEYALTAINHRFHKEFKLIGHYYDFYLMDENILIEVDGEFWHPESLDEAKYKMQKKNYFNDIVKDALAASENIPLIRIRENRIYELKADELQEELQTLINEKIKERTNAENLQDIKKGNNNGTIQT